MGRVLAYLCISGIKEDLDAQKTTLLDYARQEGIQIDDFLTVSTLSKHKRRGRRINRLCQKLTNGDTLIVTELCCLGGWTGEVIDLLDELIQGGVHIMIIKQNLSLSKEQNDIQSLTMITFLSLFAQMERAKVSNRSKELLAAKKAQGIRLGKPKGIMQKSMYDKDREQIVELLQLGMPVNCIAKKYLKYGTPSSLNYYITTRKLQNEVDFTASD